MTPPENTMEDLELDRRIARAYNALKVISSEICDRNLEAGTSAALRRAFEPAVKEFCAAFDERAESIAASGDSAERETP